MKHPILYHARTAALPSGQALSIPCQGVPIPACLVCMFFFSVFFMLQCYMFQPGSLLYLTPPTSL